MWCFGATVEKVQVVGSFRARFSSRRRGIRVQTIHLARAEESGAQPVAAVPACYRAIPMSCGVLSCRVVLGPACPPQAARLRAELSTADRGRREEEAGAAIKLRTATRQAEELQAELARVKSEAAEKARQLLRHRDQVRYSVSRLPAPQSQSAWGLRFRGNFPRTSLAAVAILCCSSITNGMP